MHYFYQRIYVTFRSNFSPFPRISKAHVQRLLTFIVIWREWAPLVLLLLLLLLDLKVPSAVRAVLGSGELVSLASVLA